RVQRVDAVLRGRDDHHVRLTAPRAAEVERLRVDRAHDRRVGEGRVDVEARGPCDREAGVDVDPGPGEVVVEGADVGRRLRHRAAGPGGAAPAGRAARGAAG